MSSDLILECTAFSSDPNSAGERDRANGKDNNDEICGEDALLRAYRKSATWLVLVLSIKIIKLIWDYYLTAIEYRERRRVAKENAKIIEEHAMCKDSELKLVEAQELKACGCINSNNRSFRCYVVFLFLVSSLVSFIILYGLEETNGLSFAQCSLPEDAAYDEPCAQVQVCAGYRDKTPYIVVRDQLDLQGPAVVAIVASIIGYIAYVPWWRMKVSDYMISRGWREGKVQSDKMQDAQMWAGLF